MSMNFSATLDPASIASAERLLLFGEVFAPAMVMALTLSLDGVEAAAQAYMWATFQNPTGPLENAFEKDVSGNEGILSNTLPYAHRRNDGFSGMTDSLGRFYSNDPGIHYMEFALQASESFIESTFAIETELAFNTI